MINTKKRLLTLMVALASVSGLTGCDQSGSDSGTLKIAVYLGGYGEVWINTLARAFEQENEGVKVEYEANPELQSEISNRLQNPQGDDIFISHGIAWEKAAVQGQLESLDDLYESVDENGVKFEDRILDNFREMSTFNGHYYKVPWTNGSGGIIYNSKMFEENNWEVPETYDELVTLCQTIYDANIKVDPTNTKPNADTIKPFVWSKETYYWDYVVFDWWAQLAGLDEINQYKQLGSAEVFNPETYPALTNALSKWVDLVAKHPEYSMEDSVGKQYIAAEMDFMNGYAAMIPCAQWLESEMRDQLEDSNCVMKLMPAPVLDGAKRDENGNVIRVNYSVGAGDSIIIPSASKNKSLAKKFIQFMMREDNAKLFTEKTNGVLLACKYPENLELSNSTPFVESLLEINNNSQKFDLYSSSRLVLDGYISLEWGPEGIQPYSDFYNYYNNLSYIKDPENYPEKSVSSYTKSAYETIASNWSKWVSQVS